MIIKTKLTLIPVLLSITAIGLVSLMFYSVSESEKLQDILKEQREITDDLADLSLLTYEYYLHKEERMKDQWLGKFSKIKSSINIIDDAGIKSDFLSLEKIFLEIVDINKKEAKLILEKNNEASDIIRAYKEGLESRLITESVSLSNEYDVIYDKFRNQSQKFSVFVNNVIVFSIITTTALVILIAYIITRNINYSVSKLENAIKQVDDDFDLELLKINTHDEMQILGDAFYEMVQDLKISKNLVVDNQKIIKLQLKELKDIDIKKDEFAAMTSHELRTPLTPIIGYCDMLLSPGLVGNLNYVQRDNVKEIVSNANHLLSIIERILTVQRLGMKKYNFNYEKMAVSDLMENIYKGHQNIMKNKNIEFLNHSSVNSEMDIDKNQLKEVFANIIQNAVDFVPETTGKIEIDVKDNLDSIEFSVRNNGPFIPKEKHEDLFKKFYQVDTSDTRKHTGMGLGLTICKGIIEGFGGKIWVESSEGKDTIFFFSIPKNKHNSNEVNDKK